MSLRLALAGVLMSNAMLIQKDALHAQNWMRRLGRERAAVCRDNDTGEGKWNEHTTMRSSGPTFIFFPAATATPRIYLKNDVLSAVSPSPWYLVVTTSEPKGATHYRLELTRGPANPHVKSPPFERYLAAGSLVEGRYGLYFPKRIPKPIEVVLSRNQGYAGYFVDWRPTRTSFLWVWWVTPEGKVEERQEYPFSSTWPLDQTLPVTTRESAYRMVGGSSDSIEARRNSCLLPELYDK
ncbi:MAG: hypothetical protein HONBIEJF_02592 [Fimbriimonadaceae bacterium]|nr:hypothetical protein [Fimbriimonadaceae bacterium]